LLRPAATHSSGARGCVPKNVAAMKLLDLAIRHAGIQWRRPNAWTAAMGRFAIRFAERCAVAQPLSLIASPSYLAATTRHTASVS